MRGARTLAELSRGRFVLGLGASHPERVGPQRGHEYLPALSTMTAYLDAYEAAPYTAPLPAVEPPLVIAALRRRMVTLAGARTDGAFPFFVPLSYAARARAWVDEGAASAGRGSRPLLIVALPVVLAENAAAGLAAARAYSTWYIQLVNYRANLLECGFTEADLEPPGSERVMREVVAIGDVRRGPRQGSPPSTTPGSTTSRSSPSGPTARWPTRRRSRRLRHERRGAREHGLRVATFDCYGTLVDWEGGAASFLYQLAAREGDPDPGPGQVLRDRWEALQFDLLAGPYRPYRSILAVSLEAWCRERGYAYQAADGGPSSRPWGRGSLFPIRVPPCSRRMPPGCGW